MSDPKKTNPWAEDVAKLKAVLEERRAAQLEESAKRMGGLSNYAAGLEKRIFASMGIPKEFFKDCKVTSHVHDSVTVEMSKAAADKIHTLQHAAKNYCMPVGGKAKGSVPLKNVSIDKKLLWGLLYGANPGVSMGASVMAGVKAQVGSWGKQRTFPPLKGTQSGRFSSKGPNLANNGTYKVVSVIDECQVYIEPIGTGIMCQPVVSLNAMHVAGYMPACAECAHGMHCLRQKYPNVCAHCRATVPQHVSGPHSFDGTIEAEYCRLQMAEERVSTACPLFDRSLMVCAHCREARPYVTRIRIPDRRNLRKARFKTIKVRRVPPPQATFRDHLAQHQKGRGNLHEVQRARHDRKTPHAKPKQAERRPRRRVK